MDAKSEPIAFSKTNRKWNKGQDKATNTGDSFVVSSKEPKSLNTHTLKTVKNGNILTCCKLSN